MRGFPAKQHHRDDEGPAGPLDPARVIWVSGCGLMLCMGLFGSLMVMSLDGMIMLFIIAATVTAMTTVLRHGREDSPDITTANLARTASFRGCIGGTCVVGLVGLGSILQVMLWPLLLVAAATSPPAVAFYRRRFDTGLPPREPISQHPVHTHEDHDGPMERPEATDFLHTVKGLTDAQLCRAWRSSYHDVQRADCPHALAVAAVRRQCHLDEIERRYPDAFKAWLDSGPRAAGDPEKFVGRSNRNNGRRPATENPSPGHT